jgi:hypothetical protein
MKKRISDLDIDQLRLEAAEAWSEAANRALRARLELGGSIHSGDTPKEDAARTSQKPGKTRVNAA